MEDWRHLRLTDEDLRALELRLMVDPTAGKVIASTGGLRKFRFAPPSWRRGKSGAIRICYAFFPAAGSVYLIAAYAKNEKENLSRADRLLYKSLLAEIGGFHRSQETDHEK